MKIGIGTDNFKLDKFREELTRNGFPKFTVEPFVGQTSVITLYVRQHQRRDVANICYNVEQYFKTRIKNHGRPKSAR
jgi:hypothetical protein